MANLTVSQWAAGVLRGLGYQQKPGAMQALIGWAKAEGGHWNNQAKYNPLNTTQPEPGAGNTGSQGNIKVYKNWDQGIDAAVTTLRNGRYGGILAGLKSGDPNQVVRGIANSPWGTSGDLAARTILGTKAPTGTVAAPSTSSPSGSSPSSSTTTVQTDPSASVVAALDAMPLPERKKPVSTIPIQAPSFSSAPVVSGQAIQTTAPEKKPTALEALKTLDIREPQMTTTTTETSDTPDTSGGGTTTTTGGGKVSLPKGVAKFEGTEVAAWIKPALVYARQQGWKGQVNSGYRSFEDQTRIYNSGVRPAAKPGTSNHEGSDFPRGAVDVSDAAQLSKILKSSKWATKLIYAGTKDPVHFSHPHGGSY